MDDRFFTACFPGQVRVCGRVLNDLTPYHYLMLKAIHSPFVDAEGVNRPSDLLAAIAVCRNSFGVPVNLKLSIRDIIWRLRMDRNERLFKREAIKFSQWMANHSSGPRFYKVIVGGPQTRELTGPDILTLVVPMLIKTSMSEKDIWNMSLGRAQWLNAEIQEIEGSDRRFAYEEDLTEGKTENA